MGAKKRESDLNAEIEKYLESNEDLFTQNEELNEELDDLRNQHIGTLANSGSTSGDITEEKESHARTKALLTDYLA